MNNLSRVGIDLAKNIGVYPLDSRSYLVQYYGHEGEKHDQTNQYLAVF